MTYEDELRDAGRYIYGDVLAGADWIRAELSNSSSCESCGSPDPAIIEGRFCCDCTGDNAEGYRMAREDRDDEWTNREGMPEFNGAFGG